MYTGHTRGSTRRCVELSAVTVETCFIWRLLFVNIHEEERALRRARYGWSRGNYERDLHRAAIAGTCPGPGRAGGPGLAGGQAGRLGLRQLSRRSVGRCSPSVGRQRTTTSSVCGALDDDDAAALQGRPPAARGFSGSTRPAINAARPAGTTTRLSSSSPPRSIQMEMEHDDDATCSSIR